jgi:hypothetical protein
VFEVLLQLNRVFLCGCSKLCHYCFARFIAMPNSLQASQGGYAVDYVTQGAQGGFPGNFLNQNSQPGYSRFGSGNDFMSQVCFLTTCFFFLP